MKYVLLVVVLALASAVRAQQYVWVEAETAADKVEHSNDWYAPVDRETSLSAKDWWHSFDEPNMKSGYMVCPFRIAEAGTYRLGQPVQATSPGGGAGNLTGHGGKTLRRLISFALKGLLRPVE